ncbi:NDR1/HIN1-like protein 1 [Musa acuminata AAA Group]|uniref:NDR1/HIN1-like protein 1 n=1 Tax=Musa acuminata AAA Group TaxID=214697 RepID=UPI0031D2E7AF
MGTDCGNHGTYCSGACEQMGTDCGNHGTSISFTMKVTLAVTITFSITIGLPVSGVVAYRLLRPTKPCFYIQNATIYQFNLSSTPDGLLSSVMHVSVSSLNPNGHVGLYYDRLGAHAAYMDQRITLPSALSPGFQGHKDVTVWSLYLYGATVPVSPQLVEALLQEQAAGYLRLHVKFQGKVRWKLAGWISGHYHLGVSCPVSFALQNMGEGEGAGTGVTDPAAFRFQSISQCGVHV